MSCPFHHAILSVSTGWHYNLKMFKCQSFHLAFAGNSGNMYIKPYLCAHSNKFIAEFSSVYLQVFMGMEQQYTQQTQCCHTWWERHYAMMKKQPATLLLWWCDTDKGTVWNNIWRQYTDKTEMGLLFANIWTVFALLSWSETAYHLFIRTFFHVRSFLTVLSPSKRRFRIVLDSQL